MFVGSLNSTVRTYLGNVAAVFNGRKAVVGCSGNFTSEAVLTQCGHPAEIHSNDVSLYSCMLGRFLMGQPVEYEILDDSWKWVEEYGGTPTRDLAILMMLADGGHNHEQNNPYQRRIWKHWRFSFPELVNGTAEKLNEVKDAEAIKLTSYYEGDVWEHFERFGDDSDAVFCAYAPTYAGGYERMFRWLEKIIDWDRPSYELLTDERRDQLLAWMRERPYLWYDDRLIPDMEPVMYQNHRGRRTVYLYSNIVGLTSVFKEKPNPDMPMIPLADEGLEITHQSDVRLVPVPWDLLGTFKDVFLGRKVFYTIGGNTYPYLVAVDGEAVGFLEFSPPFVEGRSIADMLRGAYMKADFAVSGTRYKRLSKLLVMLAISGETCKLLEKQFVTRLEYLNTTAFTERPVSMKYRGAMELVKRGQDKMGKPFLQYRANFNDLTWTETLRAWMDKHSRHQW